MLIADTTFGSEPVDLSAFLGGLERGCRLPGSLAAFRSDLNARYTFEEGSRRSRTKARIPETFAAAIGKARAADRGEYTEITVPLSGLYRGLRTRSISFSIGHSNGVDVTILAFEAARSEVERAIGSDVARTQKSFETDPDEKDFGFSARISDLPRGSALICDTST